jgi:hypothetical protein
MSQRIILFLLSSIMVAQTTTASAGLLLRFEEKEPQGEKGNISTFQLEGKKLRLENSNGRVMIFDGEQQKLWSIDTKEKSYSEITEADGARIKEAREKMEIQMKEQMGRMPSEQRMQMEEMLQKMKQGGNDTPRKMTFEPIEGNKNTRFGLACKLHRVIEEGKPIEEICFIPWKESGLSIQDFQAFDAFEQFLKKIGADTTNQGRIFQELKQSPGIPAHIAVVGQEKSPRREKELTALKRQEISPSQFSLPEGLQKKPTAAGPGGASR